ncbi:ABC transporter G family member 28-like isoform X1 [Iris pallida]|uniref:ABC transporter G family member 28-like isoform X1 n=1 Tax=Iris pallida TaxID=29817 RepID=A0AAX6IH04_IRIPA|nr:ABC transporter G family member 28-like isoform X1 [Iris pallida]
MRPWWAPPPASAAAVLFFLLLLTPSVVCQDDDGEVYSGDGSGGSIPPYLAPALYGRLLNVSDNLPPNVTKKLEFCITDVKKEVDTAFNFSGDLTFMNNCLKQTSGDLSRRLCTAAEIMFYFNSFVDSGGGKLFLRPNNNCNLTSWVSGCEPGWACSVGESVKVNLKETKVVPARTLKCSPCCAGFFCPQGITCMIPCPLGAYCPVASLNNSTGVCDPYTYQLPPGQPNHTCGGADVWADVGNSGEMFCPAGYYCPSTISKISCSKGHYCRKGSISQASKFLNVY